MSTQPSMCSSVDLPQPDGPQMATYSPAPISQRQSRTATTGPAGIGKTARHARASTTAAARAHDTTSLRSVAAIGSRATSHIG